MPEKTIFQEIPAWVQTVIAALGGFVSALVLALINRGPALQTIVAKQFETLLEADIDRMQRFSEDLKEAGRKLEQLQVAVETLSRHIVTLEGLLAANGVQAPPRPTIGIVET